MMTMMRPEFRNESPNGELCIVESVHGTWHYHVAPPDRRHEAVCGAHTMQCGKP